MFQKHNTQKENIEMKCKCGKNEAVWNEKLQQFELCDECKDLLFYTMSPRYITNIGFGDIYIDAFLDDFKKEFVDQLLKDTNTFTNNLFLTGNSNVGKTYLMSAIASYLMRRKSESMLELKYKNLIDMLNDSYGTGDSFYPKYKPFCTCKYLFLDEIYPVTGADYNILYSILNERMNRGVVTISASNYELSKLNGQIVTRLLANNGVHYELSRKIWSK